MAGRSRVVFVGNIPYDMAEEQLISIFSEVGPVVGFRLVFDRDTGKPKGYGFCEFHDPETAASAVRNLNDVDVGGRSLRIDWADVDPVFQGRTTQMGQIDGELPKREGRRPGFQPGGPPQGGPGGGGPPSMMGGPPAMQQQGGPGGFPGIPQGTPLPPGKSATDAITDTLATLPPQQLLDVMGHIKSLVLTSPKDAHGLLSAHPQLTYALFQAMLMMNLVDPAILQRTLAGSGVVGPTPQQPQGPGMGPGGPLPPFQQQQPQQRPPPPPFGGGPPPPQQQQQQQRYPPNMPPSQGPPPAQQQPYGPYGGQGVRPPPPPPAQVPYSNTPPTQHPVRPMPYGNAPPQSGNPYATNTPPINFGAPPGPPQQQHGIGGGGGGAGGPLAALSNPDLPDSQRQLLNQVLSLSDAQIAALPADQRDSIMMLRRQYGK